MTSQYKRIIPNTLPYTTQKRDKDIIQPTELAIHGTN